MEKQKSLSTSVSLKEDEPPQPVGLLLRKTRTKKSPALNPLFKEMGLFLIEHQPEIIKQNNFCWIEVVRNIDTCQELWKEFEPAQTFFDTWEFRMAFYQAYQHKPYFMVLRNQKEVLALLPLWYEEDEKKYFWFGSWWQEEVRLFAKKPEYIIPLIHNAPKPFSLNAICQESVNNIKGKLEFQEDDSKYILRLGDFKTHEDYLMTIKKNARRNLRKDRNRVLKMNPQIIIDDFSNIEDMIKISKKRFSEENKSTDWEDPRRIETFRNVIKLSGPSYKIRMITIKINGKVAGVDLITLFKDTYLAVKCGYDVKEFSGIGNFMNLIEIDDALKLGMKKIDFLQNNYQWKSGLFESVPLFKYER
ncbi:MAG: GNAT family N-acetyltransferase [Patescibacteria group bacterium]|nr:GNAT family N-acetyltransferase [Patescibacteria group bacterium]MBU1876789.1 GNAT family N-acetyltransferase [Patescibacteria group bacterium]